MTPKLENEVFSRKSTQIMSLERHKEPYNIAIWTSWPGSEKSRSLESMESVNDSKIRE